MGEELRTIRFKASYWGFEDTEENKLLLYINGNTAENESVHVTLTGYTPHVYVQLPTHIKWNKDKCEDVYNYFCKIMRSDGDPTSYNLLERYSLRKKKKINTMRIFFPTHRALQSFGRKCRNTKAGFYIEGLGNFKANDFQVHEQNIDPIIKFTALKSINPSGWLEATEYIPDDEAEMTEEERKFTTADIDMYVDFDNLEPIEIDVKEMVIIKKKYIGFDFECNSVNHNSKMPDPTEPGNKIFLAGVTTGIFGDPSSRKRYMLSLYKTHPIKNIEVIVCKDEKSLIKKFIEMIVEFNPDLFITYNGMKFDWNYLIARAELLGLYPRFLMFSRIIGKKADIKSSSWSSSAYGEQEFRYIDAIGSINIDVLLEVERNYKFSNYRLDTVAKFFLGLSKEDVSARQLFMIVQLTNELLPIAEKLPRGVIPKSKRIEIKKRVMKILPLRRCSGPLLTVREKIMKATTGQEFEDRIRDAITLAAVYCDWDVHLTVGVGEKLNLGHVMDEMSNCMGVPASYLHTRGQQIKVLAQVFRETIFEGIVIPYKSKDGDPVKYEGAVVIEANPGDYKKVVNFDFESLYPTTMIHYNICYTTYIDVNDPIPDEECNICIFSSHVGCSHDLQRRKKKPEDIICGEFKHRFKKVIIHPDGTRENEGVMPRLERNLLSNRKKIKKELAKQQAIKDMVTGKAKPEDIEKYKSWGYPIHKPGDLSPQQLEYLNVLIIVLDAQQLALKVSANSVKSKTPVLCKINGRVCYKVIEDLAKNNTWVQDGEDRGEIAQPIDGLEVWSDIGFTPVNYVFRHYFNAKDSIEGKKDKIIRVVTRTGLVDVTEDHSLLDEDSHEVTPKQVNIGDNLLNEFYIPKDSPFDPVDLNNDEDIKEIFGLREKIPDEILNENLSNRIKYIKKILSPYIRKNNDRIYIKSISQLESAKACFLLRSVGYQVEVSWEKFDGRDIYTIYGMIYKLSNTKNPIKSLYELDDPLDDYVYDIETKSHHFSAGIGDPLLHNSAYGSMGAQQGFIPLVEGAASVTAMGRMLIKTTIAYIKYRYDNARLVYGDSVTGDTPVLCKLPDDTIEYYKIEDIPRKTEWQKYGNKEIAQPIDNLQVWSDKGFTSIKHIIKHLTCKGIFRVFTKEGVVDVTEDHSLLDHLGKEIKPNQIDVDTKLMHHDLPIIRSNITNNKMTFTNKLEAAKYFLELSSLGFPVNIKNVTCGTTPYDGEYEFSINEKGDEKNHIIQKLFYYSGRDTPQCVYDLETENHHFAAGIGKLIVHNTDSSMITFEGLSLEESFKMGETVSKQASHFLKCMLLSFYKDDINPKRDILVEITPEVIDNVNEEYMIRCPTDGKEYRIDKYPRDKMNGLSDDLKIDIHRYDACPINLQFENLYGRYFLLTKKRYVAYAVNKEGKTIKIIKKGVVLTRRDNCQYLRDTYEMEATSILDEKSEAEIHRILYDRINMLFTRQISDSHLIVYKGIKTVMNYAKKKEKKQGRQVVSREFVDVDGIVIDDPTGPLDPRLVYPNLEQVILALRMLRRGDDVPPNTRLEYLFLENPNAEHQGDKAEDYTYYRENKSSDPKNILVPDYLHYIEKQLMNPITELLQVKFKHPRIPHEKIDDALKRVISELNSLLSFRVEQVKNYTKTITKIDMGVKIGWKVMCLECAKINGLKKCKKHSSEIITYKKSKYNSHLKKPQPVPQERSYSYRKWESKVEYILESAQKKKDNPQMANEIDEKRYPELLEVCKSWKARNILDSIYSQYKVKKRPSKRPTQTGEKLRIATKEAETQVMLTKKYDTHPKHTVFTLKNIHIEEDKTQKSKKKKYLYFYDMQLTENIKGEKIKDGEILKRVPRNAITTFRIKDSTIIKDILIYRGHYKNVVIALSELFGKKITKMVFDEDTISEMVFSEE